MKETTAVAKPVETQLGFEVPASPEKAINSLDLYPGAAQKAFKQEAIDLLLSPIDPNDVEIRPDGIVYMPEIKYRRVLNKAFGPGAWAMVPRSDYSMHDNTMTREYALFIHGRFVSEARGEQDYIANNPNMTYATASEGVKSNALMRCCKDLGISSELWDPGYIEKWKDKHAIKVWIKDRKKGGVKPAWRRTDRESFHDETGTVRTVPEMPARDPVATGEGEWDEEGHSQPPVAETEPHPSDTVFITDKQRKRFYAIWKQSEIPDDLVKETLQTRWGITSTTQIPRRDYQDICEWAEKWTPFN